MAGTRPTKVALVWSQLSEHHVDRCIALAQRLDGRARVLAIEVATTSRDYADFRPGRDAGGVERRTLYPGRSFNSLPRWRRALAVLREVLGCRTVLIGVPYGEVEFLLLAWVLRLLGKRVVLLCDSKFEGAARTSSFEFFKGLSLSCFNAVMVAGSRSRDYFRFLGFRRRQVLPGCGTVDVARIQNDARSAAGGDSIEFALRDFAFVGRFIPEKNLLLLIEAFALYCRLEPESRRRLLLVGSGPLEDQLRRLAAESIPDGRIVFTGFLSGEHLYGPLSHSLGLLLVSCRETWGLVINEALALGLPVISSEMPGARDLLVRDLVNGFVVENGSAEGIARAMQRLGSDEGEWRRMGEASLSRAPLGNVHLFADSAELLLFPDCSDARQNVDAVLAEFDRFRGRPETA